MGDEASGNDGGVREGDQVDRDYLEEMFRGIGPEVILKCVKGLENLETVKKSKGEFV